MSTEHGVGGWAPMHSWKHREDALTGALVRWGMGLRVPTSHTIES